MKRNINKIIKQFLTNKDILRSSIRSSVSALLKMLLLHRLQKMRFFKPFALIIRLLLKWSAYTSIFSLFYSVISSIFNLQLDLTFWFSILYALWLILSEGILDYVINSGEAILNYLTKLTSKIFHKLESNPTTIKQADKLQERYNILTVEELNEQSRRSRKDIDVNDEMEYERKKQRSIIGRFTPDYTNPNNYNTDYWTYAYYAATAIASLLGAYLIYSFFTGDTTVLYYCWDKIKDGYYYLSSCIPDSIKNYLWRKFWPFDRDPHSPSDPSGDGDDDPRGIYFEDKTDPRFLPLSEMKTYIEQQLGMKPMRSDIWIRSHYRVYMESKDYVDNNNMKSLVEYYLAEADKATFLERQMESSTDIRDIRAQIDAQQQAEVIRQKALREELFSRLNITIPEGAPKDPTGGPAPQGGGDTAPKPSDIKGKGLAPNPTEGLGPLGGGDVTPRPKTVDLPETTGDSSGDSKGKGPATPSSIPVRVQDDPRVIDYIKRLTHVYDPNCICKDCLFTNKNPKTIIIREFMNQIPPQIVDITKDGDTLDIVTQLPDHVINCRCPMCNTNKEKFTFIRKFFMAVENQTNSPEDELYNYYRNTDLSNIKLEPILEEPEDEPKPSGSKKSHSLPPLLLTNKFNSIKNNKRPYSTNAGSDPDVNESITKVYHIKDVNNYLITVLIKFFDSINLDGAWGIYPSNTVRDIAKDKCIELSIKLQNFQVDKTDTEDYGLPLITLVQNAPVDLTDKKVIFGFIFFIIHRVIALTEINKNLFSDKGLNVIFEYKYISIDDYTNKVDLFKDQVLNENFPFGPVNK